MSSDGSQSAPERLPGSKGTTMIRCLAMTGDPHARSDTQTLGVAAARELQVSDALALLRAVGIGA